MPKNKYYLYNFKKFFQSLSGQKVAEVSNHKILFKKSNSGKNGNSIV